MANRHERRHGAPKKSNAKTWIILVLVLVVLGALIYLMQNRGTGVDYTPYSYTDDEFANPNATVIIQEFSDFECPYCQQLAPTIRAVREGYPNVRVEYKQFPLSSLHPQAQLAAEASECAREQNRFWAYHDVLFESKMLDKRSLVKHAEGLGLDMQQFEQCLDTGEMKSVVRQDQLEGQQKEVRGTPAVFVNGEIFNGRSLQDFAAVINAN